MALHLLGPGPTVRPLSDIDDPAISEATGPAVVLESGASGDASNSVDMLAGHPHSYREAGGDWVDIGYEAADHWTQMTPQLRQRLIADPLATFDVSEFKIATNGGSASIITSNWVYSGSPRVYRVAGQLRELVTVLGELSANAL